MAEARPGPVASSTHRIKPSTEQSDGPLEHTPLFFTGDIPMADVVFIIAASIVFAWMIVGTRGSVLLAMIMHATSNAVSGEYISPMFSGADGELLGWIRSGIWVVIAAAVVIAANKRFRSAPSSPTQVETLVAR